MFIKMFNLNYIV